MLLESVSSTVKRVEELLNSFNENRNSQETPFQVENHLTGMLYIFFLKSISVFVL